MWTIARAHVSTKNGKMEDKLGQKILFLKMKTILMCLRCKDQVPGSRGTLWFTNPGLLHWVQVIVNTSTNERIFSQTSSPQTLILYCESLWMKSESFWTWRPTIGLVTCKRLRSEMAIPFSLYFSLFPFSGTVYHFYSSTKEISVKAYLMP